MFEYIYTVGKQILSFATQVLHLYNWEENSALGVL